jgi:hypothetical protein
MLLLFLLSPPPFPWWLRVAVVPVAIRKAFIGNECIDRTEIFTRIPKWNNRQMPQRYHRKFLTMLKSEE